MQAFFELVSERSAASCLGFFHQNKAKDYELACELTTDIAKFAAKSGTEWD
jgi:hypothetical protein